MRRFQLRWAWRDLRRRVFQILAISVIVALGAGIYAGLSSTSLWRRRSIDTSLARLDAHDVRVGVVDRTVDEHALSRVLREDGAVGRVETRLVVDAPVTASHDGKEIPAAGEIVGTDLSGPHRVDRWRVMDGRDLGPGETGSVLLDLQFARAHGLPPSGKLRVGRAEVRYVGLAMSPGYFNLVTTAGEAIQGQATRAILYAPIGLARRIGGVAPGQVNDAVVTLRRDTGGGATVGPDEAGAARRLAGRIQASIARDLPGVAAIVTARADDRSLRALYDEIDSEQQLFDVFALLIIVGAGFAVFMLTRRIVEAQRREIGIAMALGVPPPRIAVRTVTFAIEIAILGAALGVGAGWLIGRWILSVIRAQAPLPYWSMPFPAGTFALAVLVALVVPLAATVAPVWRAVRVQPVEALVPAHLRAGRHRLTHLLRRTRLPGTIALQTPWRRIVRAPVRSVLTILAIAFIMTPLLAAFGATDSVTQTVDAGERLLTGRTGDRLVVQLRDHQPVTSPLVAEITGSPLVGRSAVGLDTGGFVRHGGRELGISISMGDFDDPLAVPPDIAEQHLAPGGIVISRKAASDLGVRRGGTVVLRHPTTTAGGFRFTDTRLPVRALVDSPYRFVAYMDLADPRIMGFRGIVNTVRLKPAAGVSMDELRRDMSRRSGVASALPTSALSRTMRDILALMGNLFVVLQLIIAALAFLVAYNASNIGAEERSREHATMFAFGIRIRRVALMAVGESFALAVIGVGLSLGFGAAALHWILASVFPAAIPDLAVLEDIEAASYLVTVGIALAAALAAPWLNVRRLRNMDVPSTLRYVE